MSQEQAQREFLGLGKPELAEKVPLFDRAIEVLQRLRDVSYVSDKDKQAIEDILADVEALAGKDDAAA